MPPASRNTTRPAAMPDDARRVDLRRRLAGLSAADRARLAAKLAACPGTRRRDSSPVSPSEGPDGAKPLSFAQEWMWLLEQTSSSCPAYHRLFGLRFRGPLDVRALERGWNEVLRRHAVLRSRISGEPERLQQRTVPFEPVSLPLEEVLIDPPAGRDASLRALAEQEVQHPFDLACQAPWHTRLLRLGANDHALLITFHHIAFDGWSAALLEEELAESYRAFQADRTPGLPPLRVQYADHAARQRADWEVGRLAPQLTWWKERLAGYSGLLSLPTDFVPSEQPVEVERVTHLLPADLIGRLERLGRANEVTLFTTLLAGMAALLERYSGQEDVVLGMPVAGRTRSDIQRLIGCFINTLPVRVDLSGNPDVRQFLSRVKQEVVAALAHQELPFGQLVSALDLPRPTGRPPLAQVIFQLRPVPENRPDWAPLEVTQLTLRSKGPKADLTVEIMPTAKGHVVECEYRTDLFRQESITGFCEHYERLLRSMVETPEAPLDHLSCLSEQERHRILVAWNRTEREYPRDRRVDELFDEQAEGNPEAVAISDQHQHVTYAELEQRADRLAAELRKRGVRSGTLVGVCLHRSPEVGAALLGILKAGGAYVPLDPDEPAARLAWMLRDSQVALVVVEPSTRPLLPAGTPWCSVDPGAVSKAAPSADGDALPRKERPLAYMMYTSGSSGEPKGVRVSHRAIVRLVRNCDYVRLGPKDVVAQIATTTFDASTFENWGALLNGARIELIPTKTVLSPEDFDATLRERKVNTLFVTTALFNMLAGQRPAIFASLKQVLFGGEPADSEAVRRVLAEGAPQRLLHVYGPTEATTFATWQLVSKVPARSCTVPIGRPLANTTVYLLDAHRKPSPIGFPGEIYIGGDAVAEGYHRRPELTAQRFLPDPFSRAPDARLYRTGDRARWRADGTIEFLGRMDHQVKLRGYRIEPGEVEAALRRHPSIQACAVSPRGRSSEDRELVAYIVSSNQESPTTDVLRRWLAEKLPDYMIPSRFVALPALPLTPNGKVDRRALADLDGEPLEEETRRTPPQNLTQRRLAEIWQAALGCDAVGIRDNFFELGGHSLMAAKVVAAIEKTFGQRLDIAALFQTPTIEQLAARLARTEPTCEWQSLVPLKPTGSAPPVFFVHGLHGGVYEFLKLVRLLPTDQPAYGFQAVGLNGNSPRHTTIEEMAACYVQELLAFAPEGPWSLAGYSMGGLIAYEMACQLHAKGREVAPLILFDTHPIAGLPTWLHIKSTLFYVPRRIRHHLARWRRIPVGRRWNYYRGRFASFRRLLWSNRAGSIVDRPPDSNAAYQPRAGFASYYHEVAIGYRLRPYPGRVDLVVSEGTNPHRLAAWAPYIEGELVRHPVSGEHGKLLQPGCVEHVAELYCKVLHEARRK